MNKYIFMLMLGWLFSAQAHSLSFDEVIEVTLVKIGDFFGIAGDSNAGSGSVGLGCDCDQSIYDYCEGTTVTTTRGGSTITYSYSEVLYCDVFGNGYDYAVAPKVAGSTVTLVNTTPLLTGSNDSLRNGFDVNPIEYDSNRLDGRIGGLEANTYPYAIDTSEGKITSIVKAESRTDTSDCRDDSHATYERGCFNNLDIMTVLSEMPEGGLSNYLRPPYYGSSTSKVLRSRSSVDLSRLPAIPKQVRGTDNIEIDMDESIDDALSILNGLKVAWQRDYVATERFKAYENFNQINTGYAPTVLGQLWNLMQYIYLDPDDFDFTQAQKEELAYRLVEHGLDAIQIVLNYPRGDGPWTPNGGHGVGRYGFAAIAMALLDDGGALAAQLNAKVNGSDLGEQSFAETGQLTMGDDGYVIYGTRNVPEGRTTQSCLTAVNQLPRHNLGLVDNGRVNDYLDPDFATNTNCNAGVLGSYQHIASPVFVQQAVLCMMIPSCKAVSDQEWLKYSDRIVTTGAKAYAEEDPAAGVVVDVPVFYTCSGGPNDGLIALFTSDCAGGTRVAPNNSTITGAYSASSTGWIDSTRNSRFGLIMYEKMRECLQNSSCEGQ